MMYKYKMLSFDILNEENILNELVVATKIHKERLKIENKIELTETLILNLELNKMYLFIFEDKNIEFMIDGYTYKLEKNALFFENKEYHIFIQNKKENDSIKIKLYTLTDVISPIQKNRDNLLLVSKKFMYKQSNNIFLLDCKHLFTNDICEIFQKYIDNTKDFDEENWARNRYLVCKYICFQNIENVQTKNFFIDYMNYIFQYLKNYLSEFYNIDCSGIGFTLLRKIYGPTKLHIDKVVGDMDIIDNKYYPIDKTRNMSIIIGLNDDYEGGEFYFPVQDYSIKLKRGDVLAFPPYWTHPHMVNAPTNGTYRYTLTTFLFQ